VETAETPEGSQNAQSKNLIRVLVLAGFFVLKAMPAGVVLFIGTNGVLQTLQGLVLRVPGIRQRLRIPPMKSLKPPSPPSQDPKL
ncbi:hypothetical protein DL93DRAFT_2168442, partial [Clavulina sp. PMI_390]